MPRKNSLKIYVENAYYHLYNRGVEKRDIFLDERDYKVFLYFLKEYLQPLDSKDLDPLKKQKSLADKINLLAYCLMTNHFHLLVKQKTKDGITKLMKKIGTSYAMYFNKRYERIGPLFQGVYKAVMIESEEQLLHLSRYIHANPLGIKDKNFKELIDYSYSSYGDYSGERKTNWLNSGEILSYFNSGKSTKIKDRFSYQSFVEAYEEERDDDDFLEG